MEVTYSYYKDSYGGDTVPLASWQRYYAKAEARLQRYTFHRLKNKWPEMAKNALCEMVEAMYSNDKHDNKVSENTDGYSVTYQQSNQSIDSTLYNIARTYLSGTGYMSLVMDHDCKCNNYCL